MQRNLIFNVSRILGTYQSRGVAFDAIKITDSVLPEETAGFLRHAEDSPENMLFVIPAGHSVYAVK